jgi:hypothetical protein
MRIQNLTATEWFSSLNKGEIFHVEDLVDVLSIDERTSTSLILGYLIDRKLSVVCRPSGSDGEWKVHSLALCSLRNKDPAIDVAFKKN